MNDTASSETLLPPLFSEAELLQQEYAHLGFANIEVLNRDPLHPMAYLFAHARAIQPYGFYFAMAATFLILFIGRLPPRNPDKASKVTGLFLSFMWSCETLMVLRDSCPELSCHVVYWSLAMVFAFQSLVFLVGGAIADRFHYVPLNALQLGYGKVIGTSLIAYSFLSFFGHYSTQGLFFLLAFPLDAFTLGLLISCCSYAPLIAYVIPWCGMFFRATNTLTHFGLGGGEWALLALSVCSAACIFHRYIRPPTKPNRSHRNRHHRSSGGHHNSNSNNNNNNNGEKQHHHKIPLLQEVRPREGFAGAAPLLFPMQGQKVVEELMVQDEDGDEAHEFLEIDENGHLLHVQGKLNGAEFQKQQEELHQQQQQKQKEEAAPSPSSPSLSSSGVSSPPGSKKKGGKKNNKGGSSR